MMTKVQSLAWLPNTHNFPFWGVLKDGTRVRCRVVRHGGGYRVEGAVYADLTGWYE